MMMITDTDKDQLNYVYSVVIFSQSQVGASSGFNRKWTSVQSALIVVPLIAPR